MEKAKGPRRRVITLRVPREVYTVLESVTKDYGISISAYLEGHAAMLAHQYRLFYGYPSAPSEEVSSND